MNEAEGRRRKAEWMAWLAERWNAVCERVFFGTMNRRVLECDETTFDLGPML